MDWNSFLVIGHIIGAVFGAGGATMAEIFSIKALKDGVIDETESGFLKITYFFIRLGLFVLILSGFGLLILYRLEGVSPAMIYTDRFLAKLLIVLVIIFNPLLIQAKIIPYSVGSPLSLVSWYAALILGAWRTLDASLFSIIGVYLAAVLIAVFAVKYFYEPRFKN
ncbi:hypothetical protein HZB06_00610 [Candidatus Wolfebacteria bacterium]|nr:hypothetical protein [Candidatus Wolfebacteria bacterium]